MSQIDLTITVEDLAAIRSTFAAAARDPRSIASRFYQTLFTLDPSLRSLFHGDINNQGEKLVSMLTLVVSSLANFEQLRPTLKQLGQRHATYGVKKEYYATVGIALLETLRSEAGEAWSPQAYSAWAKAYELLAKNMMSGSDDLQTVNGDRSTGVRSETR